MASMVQEIMSPGGGVMLIPFVRVVISILLVMTIMGFIADVGRIHMVVLGSLSIGLLFSLSFFEREFKKASGRGPPTSTAKRATNKTD